MSIKRIPREIRYALWPESDFLSEEQQAKYEEALKKFSGKAYDSLNISREGSNLWKVLLLNQLGITTESLSSLDDLADSNTKFLEDHYEDAPAVALRSAGDSYTHNDYLAKQLTELIENPEFKHTLIIEGLGIKQDDKEPTYNLVFEKTERFKVFEAPDFDHKNNGKRISRINPDYSIEFDESGTRILYTREDGLSRLCVNWDLDVNSNVRILAYSNSVGRVVVVSAEGANENFEDHILELEKEKQRQEIEIKNRFNQAMAVLRGQSQ